MDVSSDCFRLHNKSPYDLVFQISEEDREDLDEAPEESFEAHTIAAGSEMDLEVGSGQCPELSFWLASNSKVLLKENYLVNSGVWYDLRAADVNEWLEEFLSSGTLSDEEVAQVRESLEDAQNKFDNAQTQSDDAPIDFDATSAPASPPPPQYSESPKKSASGAGSRSPPAHSDDQSNVVRGGLAEQYRAMSNEEFTKAVEAQLAASEQKTAEIQARNEGNIEYFARKEKEAHQLKASLDREHIKMMARGHMAKPMFERMEELKKFVGTELARNEKALMEILRKQDELAEKLDRLQLSILAKLDTNCPRLFVVVPHQQQTAPQGKSGRFSVFKKKIGKKKKSLTTKKYVIKLLCEGDNFSSCHFTQHPGYDIELTRAWVGKLLPFIRVGLKVASIACAVASSGVFNLKGFEMMLPPAVADTLTDGDGEGYEKLQSVFSDADGHVTQFGESTTNVKNLTAANILKNPDLLQESSGTLIDLFKKLRNENASKNTGDLVQRVNAANQVVWVCEDCGKKMTAISEKQHK